MRFAALGPSVALLAALACGSEPPAPSEEARAELAAIDARLDAIAEPDPGDRASLDRARKELDAAIGERTRWRSQNFDIIQWDCADNCYLELAECLDMEDGGIHPTALPGPETGGAAGLAETLAGLAELKAKHDQCDCLPDDWEDYCNWKFDLCMQRCKRADDNL